MTEYHFNKPRICHKAVQRLSKQSDAKTMWYRTEQNVQCSAGRPNNSPANTGTALSSLHVGLLHKPAIKCIQIYTAVQNNTTLLFLE